MQVDLELSKTLSHALVQCCSHTAKLIDCQEISFTKGDGVFISAGKISTVVVWMFLWNPIECLRSLYKPGLWEAPEQLPYIKKSDLLVILELRHRYSWTSAIELFGERKRITVSWSQGWHASAFAQETLGALGASMCTLEPGYVYWTRLTKTTELACTSFIGV